VSDHRDLEQELVELALGEVAEPRRSELLAHLSGCPRCRATYGEIVGAVDTALPAAPEAQPPAGFDARVLAALGIEGGAHAAGAGQARSRHTAWWARTTSTRLLLAAAAVVLVAVGGLVGAALVGDSSGSDQTAQPVPLAAGASLINNGDGEHVGTAAVAWMDQRRVLVVSVHSARAGVPYTCRVLLAQGESKVLGRWTSSTDEGGTWVMPVPEGQLNTLELVLDSGEVWSSARLP
jgi:anti-sigma factor RsiW